MNSRYFYSACGVVQCGPRANSTTRLIGISHMSLWPENVKWIPPNQSNQTSCPSHSSFPCTANRPRLVSTWRTLRTLRRMFLEGGLPRKINPCLTSSASRRVSRPHHLTQCSAHKHKNHAWVAMQERGSLFGVLSDRKTKMMMKNGKTLIYSVPSQWLDSVFHEYSSSWPTFSFIRAKIRRN